MHAGPEEVALGRAAALQLEVRPTAYRHLPAVVGDDAHRQGRLLKDPRPLRGRPAVLACPGRGRPCIDVGPRPVGVLLQNHLDVGRGLSPFQKPVLDRGRAGRLDCQEGVLVDAVHLAQLELLERLVVLDDAQRVDPDVPVAQLPGHLHGVPERLGQGVLGQLVLERVQRFLCEHYPLRPAPAVAQREVRPPGRVVVSDEPHVSPVMGCSYVYQERWQLDVDILGTLFVVVHAILDGHPDELVRLG